MHPQSVRSGPVAPPGADIDDVMARDAMWFAYGTAGEPLPTLAAPPPPPAGADVAPALPAAARRGTVRALPYGTMELLESASYPDGRVSDGSDVDGMLGRAMVAAFGLQRREPENPFNDHRCYPSVRSKFPVGVFVRNGARRQVLDVYRHALVDMADAVDAAQARDGADVETGTETGVEVGAEVVLTGRYTRLPDLYKWFRDTLVNLEIGVNLRSLCIGLELFGLSGRLRLPGGRSDELLADLGLAPTWEWSLPLAVELAAPPAGAALPAQGTPGPRSDGDIPDPVLADVVAMNRTQVFDEPPAALGPAIPRLVGPSRLSWAELLWRRSSGRMPGGLYGMSGRRRRLPAGVLADAVRWLSVPPPGELMRSVFAAIRCTAVVQDVDGHPDGLYRVTGGEITRHTRGAGLPARFEEHYLYPLAPGNGCDVRHASVIWFFSARPRDLVARFGIAGWSAAQYACGWAAQGISLSAAAAGLYARPVRAFAEIPTQRLLDLDPGEMITFAVITGTPRYAGLSFDLRL